MKNYIIILLCLALLLCGCQAAGNNTGTEPTVAPTVVPTVAPTEEPTQEPTQEPTVAPTEPPLPAGPIRSETRWVGTADYLNGDINWPKEFNLLHSVEEMKKWVDTALPDIDISEIDYSRYDDAYFENNSVVVLIFRNARALSWLFCVTNIERDVNGEYFVSYGYAPGVGGHVEMGYDATIFFIDMIGVTDDSAVHFTEVKVDFDYSVIEGTIRKKNGILADICVTP